MYYNAEMKNEKWEKEFVPIVKEIGLFELAVNVTRMCEKYLGLQISNKHNNHAEEEISDKLLEYILSSGNFGSKQPTSSSNHDSGNRIRHVVEKISNKGFFAYLQGNGLATWKLCKQYPVLKPLAFIYGMFRFIIRGTTSIIKTGKYKEQKQYIKRKNEHDIDFGIRKEETKATKETSK